MSEKINVVRVSFKGNKEVLYDFLNYWGGFEKGDSAVVSTANGLAVGQFEECVPYEKRNPKCCEIVVMPIKAGSPESVKAQVFASIKQLEKAQLEDLLS